MPYDIVYYKDNRGTEPVADWIGDPSNANIRIGIFARITDLRDYGPNLNPIKLPPIVPRGKKRERINGFYELKHRSKGWRIACYHDLDYDWFVLLNGFRKSQQARGIRRAYTLVHEYLARKERGDVQVSYRRYY